MAMLLLVFQTLYFRFFLPLWQKVKSKIGTDNLLRLHAPRFYRPLWRAGLDLTLSVTHSVTKTQMSHLETFNADSAQSKDVWNENLEFLRSSADCLLSADCLQNPNEPFRDF